MWTLSESTTKIVNQLYELSRWSSWFGQRGRDDQVRALLVQLASSGETLGLPCAAQFLLSSNEGVKQSARSTVGRLVSMLSPYDLLHVRDGFSSSYSWYVSQDWEKIVPADISGLVGNPTDEGHSAALGLLSFHHSGRVRHEAIRRLAQSSDGTELPFLLIRQNDWVEAISVDAKAAVATRINDAYADHLLRSLPLVCQLANVRRRDHRDTVQSVMDLLLAERHQDLLQDAIECSERDVRRLVISYGFQNSGEHRIRLTKMAIQSKDPTIRLKSCPHVVMSLDGIELRTTLDALTSDSFMPVRREGYRIKAEQFADQAAEIWRLALLDKNHSIRELV